MHSKFRPSPAMVVALIALFVSLGGTAAALTGSNTVQSDDLGPGAQVKAPDVAANSVGSADVITDSLTGADIGDNNSLTTGEINESTLYNDNSLTGADINEATLSGVAHTSGPFGAVDILQEDFITSDAYSPSNPNTFVSLGHPFELRSPATGSSAGSGFRLCNTSTAQFGATVYVGGPPGSTSDTRSAPTVNAGTCASIDYTGASTSASGDFRLLFSDGGVVFGTGAGIDSIGHIDILAIGM